MMMNGIYLSPSLSFSLTYLIELLLILIVFLFLFLAVAPVVCRQYQKSGWFNSKCKTCGGPNKGHALPLVPEEALRAFAESVGMPVDAMWEDVKRGDGGEIVEIDWSYKNLEGTLPVGDMHMPYLRYLNLCGNSKLTGEARGVGVTVIKFTDCFCE